MKSVLARLLSAHQLQTELEALNFTYCVHYVVPTQQLSDVLQRRLCISNNYIT